MIVLSNYISQNVANMHDEYKGDFEKEFISEEQFAARVFELKISISDQKKYRQRVLKVIWILAQIV